MALIKDSPDLYHHIVTDDSKKEAELKIDSFNCHKYAWIAGADDTLHDNKKKKRRSYNSYFLHNTYYHNDLFMSQYRIRSLSGTLTAVNLGDYRLI